MRRLNKLLQCFSKESRHIIKELDKKVKISIDGRLNTLGYLRTSEKGQEIKINPDLLPCWAKEEKYLINILFHEFGHYIYYKEKYPNVKNLLFLTLKLKEIRKKETKKELYRVEKLAWNYARALCLRFNVEFCEDFEKWALESYSY